MSPGVCLARPHDYAVVPLNEVNMTAAQTYSRSFRGVPTSYFWSFENNLARSYWVRVGDVLNAVDNDLTGLRRALYSDGYPRFFPEVYNRDAASTIHRAIMLKGDKNASRKDNKHEA